LVNLDAGRPLLGPERETADHVGARIAHADHPVLAT
jgi:hypothetical protein